MRLVPAVSDLAALGASLGSVSSFSVNLVGGTAVQVLERLISDLVHSERSISSVVAWSVRHVKVPWGHLASSWWWSRSGSWVSAPWWISWSVPLRWSSRSISAVHWWWASSVVVLWWCTSLILEGGASGLVATLISVAASTALWVARVMVIVRVEHLLWWTTCSSLLSWHWVIPVVLVSLVGVGSRGFLVRFLGFLLLVSSAASLLILFSSLRWTFLGLFG